MIDTKRWHAIQLPMRIEEQRAILEDLFALETDNAPLSRKELETLLKEEGWTRYRAAKPRVYANYENPSYDCEISINKKLGTFSIFPYGDNLEIKGIPLSAVTRATLRSCGVIK